MKALTAKIAAVVFLLSACLGATGIAATAGEKVAYMDLTKVFDTYNKTKDLDKQLEAKVNSKQSERDKMVTEIKKLKDEMELMSDKGKESKETAINEKIKKLRNFDRDTQESLKKERDDMARQIYNEIKSVIDDLGKKENYILIIDTRAILYGRDGDDLTENVLKILNDKYAKTKKR